MGVVMMVRTGTHPDVVWNPGAMPWQEVTQDQNFKLNPLCHTVHDDGTPVYKPSNDSNDLRGRL